MKTKLMKKLMYTPVELEIHEIQMERGYAASNTGDDTTINPLEQGSWD